MYNALVVSPVKPSEIPKLAEVAGPPSPELELTYEPGQKRIITGRKAQTKSVPAARVTIPVLRSIALTAYD